MLERLRKAGRGLGGSRGGNLRELPAPDTCNLSLLKKSKKDVPKEWDEIMSYPPAAKALPADRIDGILYQNRSIILRMKESLGVSDEHFDQMLMPVIRNLADFAHLIPGSEAHHHRGSGGFLRHSLEAGFYASQFAEDVIFVLNAPPKERRNQEHAWRLACALTGLMHDAGKPISDVEVIDDKGISWSPLENGLYSWLRIGGRTRYYINWREGRHKSHERFATRAFDRIVPNEIVNYLLNVDIRIMESVYDAISGLGVDHHVAKIAIDADQASVRRDAKIDQEMKSGRSFDYGLPIHRYIFTAFRTMINNGRLKINEPGGLVWHTTEGLFVNWKSLLPVLSDEVKRTADVHVPDEPEKLADEMIQRGLAVPRYPDGVSASDNDRYENFYYYYWIVTPDKLVENREPDSLRLTLLKIDDPGRIFSGEWPSATGAKIWDEKSLKDQKVVSEPDVVDEDNESRGEIDSGSRTTDAQIERPQSLLVDNENEILDTETGEVQKRVHDPDETNGSETERKEGSDNSVHPYDDKQGSDLQKDKKGSQASNENPMDIAGRALRNRQGSAQMPSPDTGKYGTKSKDRSEPTEGEKGKATQQIKDDGSSVSDVVASIDSDMEMPFGLESGGKESVTEPKKQNDVASTNGQGTYLANEEKPFGEPVGGKKADDYRVRESELSKPESAPAQKGKVSGVETEKKNHIKKQGHSNDANKSKHSEEVKEDSSKRSENTLNDREVSKTEEKTDSDKPQSKKKSFELIRSGIESRSVKNDVSPKNKNSAVVNSSEFQTKEEAREQLQCQLDQWSQAGEIIAKAVDQVIEEEGRLGQKWWIADRKNVVFRFPSSFSDQGREALTIIDVLKQKGVIQSDPKRPLSPTCVKDGVTVVMLTRNASTPFIQLLRVAELSIDPFDVETHDFTNETEGSPKPKARSRSKRKKNKGFGSKNNEEAAHKRGDQPQNIEIGVKDVTENLATYEGKPGDYEEAAQHIVHHLENGTSRWFSEWQKHSDGSISFSKETLQIAMGDLDPISANQFRAVLRERLHAEGYRSRIKGGAWWFTKLEG